jgi:hypothetical protein
VDCTSHEIHPVGCAYTSSVYIICTHTTRSAWQKERERESAELTQYALRNIVMRAREEQKRRALRKENSLPLTHSLLLRESEFEPKTQKRWRRTPRERPRLKMRKKGWMMESGRFLLGARTFFSLTQWERNKYTRRVNRKSICMNCVASVLKVYVKSMPDEQVA